MSGRRFTVLMTAPRLAPEAVAVLEAADCQVEFMAPFPSAAAVAARAGALGADAILSRQGPVTAAAMDAAPRLRVIARHGVGVDDVDVAAAARRGILVTRAPGSNTAAVAEHAMAMILALLKDLRPLGAAVAAGGWREGATRVRDAAGLRLGLLGFGAIGRAVARRALAFDMRVAAFDPGAASSEGVELRPSLDALLADTDALSLHLPLLASTRHVVGAAALAALPPGGFVVNTARGGIIDEAALLRALDAGHLAGAALDVFESEPPAADDPLRRHPRVIATPHVAGATPAALAAMGVMAAECIAAALHGRPVPPERIVRG